MDVGKIQTFLGLLGCQKISVGGEWVRSTCPLQYLHGGGQDRSPSFAVRIAPGSESRCRCLACGASGSLGALLWRLEADKRRTRPDLLQYLARYNQIDAERVLEEAERPTPPVAEGDIEGIIRSTPAYTGRPVRESRFVHPDDEPQAEVPEEVQRQMVASLPAHVIDYLTREPDPQRGIEGRGLDRLTVAEWGLGWHPLKQRISIPIRDEDGKLVAISGRRYGEGNGPKYLHSRFKRDRVLFGEHRVNPGIRKGYLFEGFFHVIYTSQYGYCNGVARMGTHLSRKQAVKLVRWFDHLVIVPDGDKAGRDAAERDARTLQMIQLPTSDGKVCCLARIDVVEMPHGKDIDSLKPDKVREVLGPPNCS